MSDYVLQIKVKNGPLLRAMREEGYETGAALARASGVGPQDVSKFLSLSAPPIGKRGQWSAAALRIAETLRRMPEDLFPPHHLERALEKRSAELELDLADLAGLLCREPESPDHGLLEAEATATLGRALDTLRPRDLRVLTRRYGLDGRAPQTFAEIAANEGVGKESIRQIEARALRRLRHPARELRDAKEVLVS